MKDQVSFNAGLKFYVVSLPGPIGGTSCGNSGIGTLGWKVVGCSGATGFSGIVGFVSGRFGSSGRSGICCSWFILLYLKMVMYGVVHLDNCSFCLEMAGSAAWHWAVGFVFVIIAWFFCIAIIDIINAMCSSIGNRAYNFCACTGIVLFAGSEEYYGQQSNNNYGFCIFHMNCL